MKATERLTDDLQTDESGGSDVKSDALWWVAFKASDALRLSNVSRMNTLRELAKQVYEACMVLG
jgi:hypothetical protein